MTLFFRLLSYDDKATELAEAVTALQEGRPLESVIYTVDSCFASSGAGLSLCLLGQ